MTRDKVIECAKDFVELNHRWFHGPTPNWWPDDHDNFDVMQACIDLAYQRTKEALIEYTKEREAKFAAHERMLDTIEATLQESIKDVL